MYLQKTRRSKATAKTIESSGSEEEHDSDVASESESESESEHENESSSSEEEEEDIEMEVKKRVPASKRKAASSVPARTGNPKKTKKKATAESKKKKKHVNTTPKNLPQKRKAATSESSTKRKKVAEKEDNDEDEEEEDFSIGSRDDGAIWVYKMRTPLSAACLKLLNDTSEFDIYTGVRGDTVHMMSFTGSSAEETLQYEIVVRKTNDASMLPFGAEKIELRTEKKSIMHLCTVKTSKTITFYLSIDAMQNATFTNQVAMFFGMHNSFYGSIQMSAGKRDGKKYLRLTTLGDGQSNFMEIDCIEPNETRVEQLGASYKTYPHAPVRDFCFITNSKWCESILNAKACNVGGLTISVLKHTKYGFAVIRMRNQMMKSFVVCDHIANDGKGAETYNESEARRCRFKVEDVWDCNPAEFKCLIPHFKINSATLTASVKCGIGALIMRINKEKMTSNGTPSWDSPVVFEIPVTRTDKATGASSSLRLKIKPTAPINMTNIAPDKSAAKAKKS